MSLKVAPPEEPPTHYTISLMVIVHVDCHHNAIRRSTGGRHGDEWSKVSHCNNYALVIQSMTS